MATSNSYDFQLNRNEIVTEALRLLNVVDDFDDATQKEITTGSRSLNMMIKAWQAQGIHLWKYEEIVVFLEKNKTKYTLSSSGDHACLLDDFNSTTTTATSSSGATTLTVSSITGIADGDNIGIELTDGTSQWTTVSGTPLGNTVTLTAALTGSVNSGAYIYSYTNKIQKPLRLDDARKRNASGTETKMTIVARDTYFQLPNKSSQGSVIQLHYNPKVSSGNLYIYPSTNDVTDTIRATVEYPIEDFDSSTNNADFPVEWTEALVYNLAMRLAPQYGVYGVELQSIAVMAEQFKQDLLDWDQEYTTVQFVPAFGDYYTEGR